MKKKITAIILTLVLLMGVFSAHTSAHTTDIQELGAIGNLATLGEAAELNADVKIADSSSLPDKYSSREMGYTTPVRQQIANICWAYSSTAALETLLMKDGIATPHLSPQHINVWGTQDKAGDGWARTDIMSASGYSYIPIGYLTSWSGPFYDTEFTEQTVFPEGVTNKEDFQQYTSLTTPDFGVTSIKYIDNTTPIDTIKHYIYSYGAVMANFNADTDNYVNETFDAFYCGDSTLNVAMLNGHSVAIVGWDDNYAKENFSTSVAGDTPKNDGAWLMKNSWSRYVNQNGGYFWISYEDAWLFNSIFGPSFVITDYIAQDGSYNIYQNEIHGATTQFHRFTYNDSLHFPARAVTYINMFDFSADDSILDSVVFESTSLGADYTAYYIPVIGGEPTKNRALWAKLNQGVIDATGYFYVDAGDFSVPEGKGAIGIEIDNTRTYEENKDKPDYEYIHNSIGVCEYLQTSYNGPFIFNETGEYGKCYVVYNSGRGDVLSDLMDEYKDRAQDDIGGIFVIKAITRNPELIPEPSNPTTVPTSTTPTENTIIPSIFTEPSSSTVPTGTNPTSPSETATAPTSSDPTESSVTTPTMPVDQPIPYKLGDADRDDTVNIKDCTLIQKSLAKLETLDEIKNLAADVTADANVTISDATAIQKHIAKIPVDYRIGDIIIYFP